MTHTLKALIFDVDGTLADTELEGHLHAFNAAFADADLDWHWDVPLYIELLRVTGGMERITHYARTYHPRLIERSGFSELVARVHANKTEYFLHRVEKGLMGFRPGVARLLSEAHQAGLTLAIATTTSPQNVERLLAVNMPPELKQKPNHGFAVIAAGNMVAAKKPAPDIYHYALDRLALQAADCLAIEDSEPGLAAALGAGLPTLITVNSITRNHNFSGAMRILEDLGSTSLADLQNWHAQAVSN